MLFHAFIQAKGSGKLRLEEQLVVDNLHHRGISIEFDIAKRICRRQLPLNLEPLVVGDIP